MTIDLVDSVFIFIGSISSLIKCMNKGKQLDILPFHV